MRLCDRKQCGEFTVQKGCLAVFFGLLAFVLFLIVAPFLGLAGLAGIAAFTKQATPTPTPSVVTARSAQRAPTPTATPDIITLQRPTEVRLKYGTAVLQPGLKLPVVARDAGGVSVSYAGEVVLLPHQ